MTPRRGTFDQDLRWTPVAGSPLSGCERETVRLFVEDELNLKEMAVALGLSIQTISSRKVRAMARLGVKTDQGLVKAWLGMAKEESGVKVYVASSWRNGFHPEVVRALRQDGHEVYDFKDEEGFHWSEVDPDWKAWPDNVPLYLRGLQHPCAERGFNRDMTALRGCDACVMVHPCGMSASLEAGWAKGSGRPLYVYTPAIREPDLMVKMADLVTDSLDAIRRELLAVSEKAA